jgi:carbon storage regulator
MLVLSRQVNESIHIGHDIVITIVRVQGGAVRVGITAPAAVNVRRSELLLTKGERDGSEEETSEGI